MSAAEGATAGDVAVMEYDMAAAAGAENPDAAAVISGGPGGGGGVSASPAAESHIAAATTAFLQDLCSGLNREMAPHLSPEQVQDIASRLLAPDAVIHADGLLHSVPPVSGPRGFFEFITQERAAYRTMSLDTLLLAVSPTGDASFALSRFKMKNVGPWHGKPATRQISEGVRIDELRFNEAGQVSEAWCNRQLFEEERELLIREPSRHHAPAFDPSLLVPVPLPEAGQGGLTAPGQLLNTWNVVAAAGPPPDPDYLDALLEPDFILMDALGFTGDDAQSHPYTAIRSLDDAKRVLLQMAHKYDIDEVVQNAAVKPGYNAVFAHWRARLTPRPPPPAAAGGSGSTVAADMAATAGAAAAAGPYTAEAVDLLVFSPASGKLKAVFQFRKPLGSDRRFVLTDIAPAGMPVVGVEGGDG
ncbi:hypothetical protein PLESTB_001744000 [Pleodorina starrii]|uniref:Uncharacterized protein n=1 Tax=Pleodorina starrii TaxID=330485 RepID=A0A9W6C0N4_9CHLO|nr:hypothetical protein PLESTM_001675400 [Pleodorina starrii]GLC61327.1 hypothetical protein PLESTB_001744000 [Pleodorina starrii]GLC69362.1 hypothetical protein PLESTF_000820900 [Pleodorina starrii]